MWLGRANCQNRSKTHFYDIFMGGYQQKQEPPYRETFRHWIRSYTVINAEKMPNARECKEKQGHYYDDDSARELICGSEVARVEMSFINCLVGEERRPLLDCALSHALPDPQRILNKQCIWRSPEDICLESCKSLLPSLGIKKGERNWADICTTFWFVFV